MIKERVRQGNHRRSRVKDPLPTGDKSENHGNGQDDWKDTIIPNSFATSHSLTPPSQRGW